MALRRLGRALRAGLLVAGFGAALHAGGALAADGAHGFAVLGSLKYPAGFDHFDYVNPDAPKGGRVVLWYQGTFDNLNPFILSGTAAQGSGMFIIDAKVLTFESLMVASQDEPDSYYGLIAESVSLPDDRRSVRFTLRPEARWHDGSPITVDDVVFSFETLTTKGHPILGILYKDILKAEPAGPRSVRFTFRDGVPTRDLPGLAATMPIVSKAWYATRDFTKSTLEAPLGSGPYRVDKIDDGRSIRYARVSDHWARDLGVSKGRYNFDEIRWDYYRDRDVSLQSLFAGKIDFREDYTSRNWATKYAVKPVEEGLIKREVLPDETITGFQAFFLNTRKAKFADRRVRQALGLMFDFEWTNKNLFYGLYKRTHSIFQNSDLSATGAPTPAEAALLAPFRDSLPAEIFGEMLEPPKTDGSGRLRRQRRQAQALLAEAGWRIRDGRLTGPDGQAMEIEFLSFSPSFERIINAYVRNLERIGIDARFRVVDSAQYQKRTDAFDFDIVTGRFGSSLTPGNGLENLWHSASADVKGSRNYSGLKSPAADAMIRHIIEAGSREELRTATSALDRVVMWSHNVVPQWYKASHTIAYWDRFGRPAVKPRYDLGFLDTWWVDAEKARRIDTAR